MSGTHTGHYEQGEAEDTLSPRIRLLREMYWARSHEALVLAATVSGSGDPTLVGRARDFATLLAASPPQIQDGELLVGVSLARPAGGSRLDLGAYDRHYPPGHHNLLRDGFAGIRDRAREKLRAETDAARSDFLEATVIAHDAACRFAECCGTHLRAASGTGGRRGCELAEIADVCAELSCGPPRSFHAALQMFWFVFLFGGRGCIGRFDQWMWPFLERDLRSGRLALADAEELLQSLWIKLNFFAGNNDSLRNMSLAGQTPEGGDGCNELTFLCLEATEKLRLPEPKLNVRFFKGSPRKLLLACCRLLGKGLSQPAIYNDEVAIPALERTGVPLAHARQYCNDGCQEIILGGMCTAAFAVQDALTVLGETVGRAEAEPYGSLDEMLSDLKRRLRRWMPDDRGEGVPVTFPFFAASIDDCLETASPQGARYRLTGNIIAEVANVADGLAAIAKLVFGEKRITWPELNAALRENFEGHEPLRQMILNRAPKFGNDDDLVDQIATDIATHFLDGVHEHARNEPGPGAKRVAGLMSFGLQAKRQLPASPDGRRQGDPTANSYSPVPGRDRNGPTAVLNSVGKLDSTKASFGTTLDLALHSSCFEAPEGLDKLASLVETFLAKPCTTTLQINVVDRDTLLRARADPTNAAYRTLIVRVWGFSAVFPELPPELQDHVIRRTQHVI